MFQNSIRCETRRGKEAATSCSSISSSPTETLAQNVERCERMLISGCCRCTLHPLDEISSKAFARGNGVPPRIRNAMD